MKQKFIVSQRYRDPDFGVVHITVRANARSFIARWKNDELSVTVPPYTTAESFKRALDDMGPRLMTRRPERRFFHVGQSFDSALHHFVIEAGRDAAYHRFFEPERKLVRFVMSNQTPPGGEDGFNRFVNAELEYYAKVFAGSILVDEAYRVASQLGLKPKAIGISRGVRTLGKCYADGRIELSRNLIFYPADHRRYVYAHEFAHLTHMDHSVAFHALLDRYLDGRERELKAASDAFRIPIIR